MAITKHGRRGSTRNLQEIRGGREDDTLRLIQRPLQILSWNHLNLIAILIRIFPLRQILVLLVMIDVKRKRDRLKETNIGVEREEIDAGTKNVRGVIRDPSTDQEGRRIVLQTLTVTVKVIIAVKMMFFMLKEKTGNEKNLLGYQLAISLL